MFVELTKMQPSAKICNRVAVSEAQDRRDLPRDDGLLRSLTLTARRDLLEHDAREAWFRRGELGVEPLERFA
jgi:hypothetical protein